MRHRLVILAVLFVLLPLAVRADSGAEPLEQNRALLEGWRKHPEHYARLRHDLEAFLALPVERQARLRELDRVLHEEDSLTYARLHRVLERYADWLQNLPESQRRKIESAEDNKQRLRL